jgi:hypothetical protein
MVYKNFASRITFAGLESFDTTWYESSNWSRSIFGLAKLVIEWEARFKEGLEEVELKRLERLRRVVGDLMDREIERLGVWTKDLLLV